MDTTHAILAFANLLEVAQLATSTGDVYGTQHELIAACRLRGTRFLAVMPLRHRFRCEVCRVDIGEAEMHFEDPKAAVSDREASDLWGTPAGAFVDIKRSALHAILAHGQAPPAALQELLASVGAG